MAGIGILLLTSFFPFLSFHKFGFSSSYIHTMAILALARGSRDELSRSHASSLRRTRNGIRQRYDGRQAGRQAQGWTDDGMYKLQMETLAHD